MLNKYTQKILCFLGLHRWVHTNSVKETLIRLHTECKYCEHVKIDKVIACDLTNRYSLEEALEESGIAPHLIVTKDGINHRNLAAFDFSSMINNQHQIEISRLRDRLTRSDGIAAKLRDEVRRLEAEKVL